MTAIRSYHDARSLAAAVAHASRAELEQIVRQLASDTVQDHAIAAYVRLDVHSVRRAIGRQQRSTQR